MASKLQSDQLCSETKVITIPKKLDSVEVAPRSAIRLVSLKLQATLNGFGFEQIKGVVRWNKQICVATDRFLVFFASKVGLDKTTSFKHDIATALPLEISHVVSIAAGSNSHQLYILSDWIWIMTSYHKLTRWIQAQNVSSISVADDDRVLLTEDNTLTMYNRDRAMIKKFSMPHEYKDMKIRQAELTSADKIVVSISGRGKYIVFLMNDDGIVKRLYDSSSQRHMQSVGDAPKHMFCPIPSQFIAFGRYGRLFVAETFDSTGSKSSCPLCQEKILTLDRRFRQSQILLPDMNPQFKNYSRIVYSEKLLIVVCMDVNHQENAKFEDRNKTLTPVVNLYKVEHDSDFESDDESENDDESKMDDDI